MSPWKCYILTFALWAGARAAPAGPLIIDPTITIDNNLDFVTNDTRLQNATKWGSDVTLMVGKKSDSVKKRTIIKFDLAYSEIPGNATILNSELQLYYYDAQRAGSSAWVDRWVQAHQVLNNWDELQADSLKRLTGVNWLLPRGKIGPGSNPASEDANGQFESTMLFQQNQTNTWKVWNLTALTQKWLNGAAANYGVILWATNEDVNAYDLRFYSRENATNKPKLVVTWSNTPKTVYFLKDHLGSVRATVDQTGAVVGYDDYDAWGYALAGRTQATQWTSLQAVAKNKFTGKERDDNFGINWDYFGARYYDGEIGRWIVRDPLAEKYAHLSPFVYVSNNPIVAFDPNGKETYFINGAGNDPSKWGYSQKIVAALQNAGVSDVKHVPITQGQLFDQLYSITRNSNTESRFNFHRQHSIDVADDVTYTRTLEPNTASLVEAVNTDVSAGNIGSDEQINLVGYSFGSVVTANAALELASQGTTVSNLVLVGSTISTNSDLYRALTSNPNIQNVIRVDIPNDRFSNPKGLKGILKGVMDALRRGDKLPHFIYALPENDADREALAKQLYDAGVR